MRFFVLPLLVCGASSLALAAPAKPAPAPKEAKASLEKVGTGELRIDGKISAILGAGVWQMEATSWTSPRGVTTDFDELKTKAVTVSPKAFIHPLGEATTVPLKDVKLGSRVGVIGKNNADGSLSVREIVLLEGYGSRKEIGSLATNPETNRLIDLSRAARDNGQLPKALQYAQDAVAAAQGIGDLSGEALATQDQALLYSELNQPERSLSSFQRAQVLGERLSNSLVQVLALGGQARLLAASGKTDEAIRLFERAVPLSATTPTGLQISTLTSLASIYLGARKRTEGVGVLTRVLALEDGSGKRDDATSTMLTLSMLLAKTEKDTARGYLDQAKPRLEFARDDATRFRLSLELALALKSLGDAGASAQFEAAAKLAELRGDTASAAKIRALATEKATDPLDAAAPENKPAEQAPDDHDGTPVAPQA